MYLSLPLLRPPTGTCTVATYQHAPPQRPAFPSSFPTEPDIIRLLYELRYNSGPSSYVLLCLLVPSQGSQSKWHLDSVCIRMLDGDKPVDAVVFECGGWLADGLGDGQPVRTLQPELSAAQTLRAEKRKYEVIITTSSLKGAGTDCGLFMQIYGDKKVRSVGCSGAHKAVGCSRAHEACRCNCRLTTARGRAPLDVDAMGKHMIVIVT